MKLSCRPRRAIGSWILFFELLSIAFQACHTLRGGSSALRRINGNTPTAIIGTSNSRLQTMVLYSTAPAANVSDTDSCIATITAAPQVKRRRMTTETYSSSTENNNNNRDSKVYSVRLVSSSARRKHTLSSLHAESWNAKYDELVAFHNRYGHTNVPQKPTKEIPTDYSELANFCRNLRCQHRYLQDDETKHLSFLTEDRLDRLEAIGFTWNAQVARWYSRYDELVEYKKEHGHVNVPQKDEANTKLANWISYQRLRYKQTVGGGGGTTATLRPLSPRQIQLLEDLEFKWDPKDEVWWCMYNDLQSYKEQHGHSKVPFNYKQSPKLYNWLNTLRKYCREYVLCVTIEGTTDGVHISGLNEERIQALRDINFCWLPQPGGGPLTEIPPKDIFDYQKR